jgi:hypothetical protein
MEGSNMEKRNIGIMVTIVTVFLCACPGLFSLYLGSVTILGMVEDTDPIAAIIIGLGGLLLGLAGVAVPVVAGILTFRKKPAYKPIFDEPIPPPN